jgi:hypothetical protein
MIEPRHFGQIMPGAKDRPVGTQDNNPSCRIRADPQKLRIEDSHQFP